MYGAKGVCQVTAVGTVDFSGGIKGRMYYTLAPKYMEGSTVYTPVDTKGSVMRPVMTREEAMELIDGIPQIEELWIKDEKGREQIYREAIKSCDNRELIRIIKTIYNRGRSRMAAGKKVTVADNKYFKIAEENVYGELAVSLGMTREGVKKYVESHVKEAIQCVANSSQAK